MWKWSLFLPWFSYHQLSWYCGLAFALHQAFSLQKKSSNPNQPTNQDNTECSLPCTECSLPCAVPYKIVDFRLLLAQAADDKIKKLEEEEERQNNMLQEKEDIVAAEDPSPEQKSSEEFQALIDRYEVCASQ